MLSMLLRTVTRGGYLTKSHQQFRYKANHPITRVLSRYDSMTTAPDGLRTPNEYRLRVYEKRPKILPDSHQTPRPILVHMSN